MDKEKTTTGNFKILIILLLITHISTVLLSTECTKFRELFFFIFIVVLISYCIGTLYPAKGLKKEEDL